MRHLKYKEKENLPENLNWSCTGSHSVSHNRYHKSEYGCGSHNGSKNRSSNCSIWMSHAMDIPIDFTCKVETMNQLLMCIKNQTISIPLIIYTTSQNNTYTTHWLIFSLETSIYYVLLFAALFFSFQTFMHNLHIHIKKVSTIRKNVKFVRLLSFSIDPRWHNPLTSIWRLHFNLQDIWNT